MKLKGSIKAICKCGATRFGLPVAKATKGRATQRKG
jgi:hypothetical protein